MSPPTKPEPEGKVFNKATAATVVWIGIAAIYAFTRTTPNTLAELKPNELGDFLAGFFAPLAFAWLALSVMMQKDELAATREELRLNGEALRLQAEELKATVEELSRQTAIMGAERQEKSEERRQDKRREAIKSLKEVLFQVSKRLNFIASANNSHTYQRIELSNYAQSLESHVAEGKDLLFFEQLYDGLGNFEQELSRVLESTSLTVQSDQIDMLRREFSGVLQTALDQVVFIYGDHPGTDRTNIEIQRVIMRIGRIRENHLS